MAILIGENTKLVVQGITGREGSFHARKCVEYGTKIVAGVTPGKGGLKWEESVPLFNTVEEAVIKTDANTSMIFVPPPFAADAILEAVNVGIKIIVCISEGIPAIDMARVKTYINGKDVHLIGPNCPGIISPGRCKVGIMPGYIHKKGNVGVISRSGTLTYEAVSQLTALGLGQSTCLGIGGDPIIGTSFVDALKLFNKDPETEGVVLIGEIGGCAEEDAATYVKAEMKKPVCAFIAGQTAPPGRRMGHAGAIIDGGKGGAQDKMEALRRAEIYVTPTPAEIGLTMQKAIKEKPR